MPQFNDTELTAAVIESFEDTPDPRVKFLLEELVSRCTTMSARPV